MKKFAVALITLLALTLSAAMADMLILPADTEVIETEAFCGIDADTVILPESVNFIGDNAFSGNNGLTVYVPDAMMERETAALGNSTDSRFVSLASLAGQFTFTSDGDEAIITGYIGTSSSIVVPSRLEGKPVTAIGNRAFQYKSFITSVFLPEGLKTIGVCAFDGCNWLKQFYFPSTLELIEQDSFFGCGSESLSDLFFVLPDQTALGSGNPFRNGKAILVVNPDTPIACALSERKLEFTFPEETDFRYLYKQSVSGGAYDTLYLTQYVGSATEIEIPTGVKVIGENAFKNNTAARETFTSVLIPEGVTVIGKDAFANCYALTSFSFPSTLTELGQNAFWGCGRDLTEPFFFDLPDNITSLTGAFTNCNAVPVISRQSATALALSAVSKDFSFPGETDFRYRYKQSVSGGAYDTLYLTRYQGLS